MPKIMNEMSPHLGFSGIEVRVYGGLIRLTAYAEVGEQANAFEVTVPNGRVTISKNDIANLISALKAVKEN